MKTLLLADIHGNLPALRAVLNTSEARSCQRIISLGDQVNFGPESRAVYEELTHLGALLLLGNHEERLLHPDDFPGYNWALMRHTANQMRGVSLNLSVDVRLDRALLTHGTPGAPFHLVYPEDLPNVLSALPEGVDLLLSGHNHHAWDVTSGGKRAFNPGSLGMLEENTGGEAAFAIWEDDRLTRLTVPYDTDALAHAYLSTGAADIAPEMARMCLHVMRTGEYQGVLKLMRHVRAIAEPRGLTLGDAAAWALADHTYPWADQISSPEYWQRMKERF